MFPNLIDGRSIETADRFVDRNPSNLSDVVGEFARGTPRTSISRLPRRAKRLRSGRCRRRRQRFDILDRAGSGDAGAQGRARPPALARARQAARRRRRRGRPRRGDLQILRRRSAARRRREDRVGPAGHRRRGHPRAARRRRRHHAVELPAGDSRLEDRAGARVRQHRRQTRRAGPGVAVVARGHRAARRAAARCPQPRHGTRFEARRGAGVVSRRGCDQLHGIAGCRPSVAAAAVKAGARVQLEMGGKNPLIVLDDADLATAVSVAVNGAYFPGRPALHGVEPADRHRRHPRSLRRRDDRTDEAARHRRCAEARHRDWAGRRRAAAGKNLEYFEIGQRGRAARLGRRSPDARRRRLLQAPAIFTDTPRRCGSIPRRSSVRSPP